MNKGDREMFYLVSGGAASGKSAFAENLAVRLGGERVYLATMQPWDAECEQRILRHRRLRSGKGFRTVECYEDLRQADIPDGGTVLVECLSNLAANCLFQNGRMQDPQTVYRQILCGVEYLLQKAGHLVVVTNELFSDGGGYDEGTQQYLILLGKLNRTLAARADGVAELVFGLPVFHKGGDFFETVGAVV